MIRNFVLRDLPTLNRYRHRGQFLDSATAITWGPTVVPAGALLTHLAPATGIFTYLGSPQNGKEEIILAQLVHQQNSACARFSFIAPENALESSAFEDLVSYMAQQIGERGAHNFVAEVEETTPMYDAMRRTGFAVYARQRVWHLDLGDADDEVSGEGGWRSRVDRDEIPTRTLYNAIVPALAQQVESPPWERQKGVAYYAGGELLAFVELQYGPRGIMAYPYFHPDIDSPTQSLSEMFAAIPNRRSRPVYIKVRSYQTWLEGHLEDLTAIPGPKQAVMVKRLALPVTQPLIPAVQELKGATTPNPTIPIARSISNERAN